MPDLGRVPSAGPRRSPSRPDSPTQHRAPRLRRGQDFELGHGAGKRLQFGRDQDRIADAFDEVNSVDAGQHPDPVAEFELIVPDDDPVLGFDLINRARALRELDDRATNPGYALGFDIDADARFLAAWIAPTHVILADRELDP